jgi:hypothetical protein
MMAEDEEEYRRRYSSLTPEQRERLETEFKKDYGRLPRRP